MRKLTGGGDDIDLYEEDADIEVMEQSPAATML
jgi:hypothetical protein